MDPAHLYETDQFLEGPLEVGLMPSHYLQKLQKVIGKTLKHKFLAKYYWGETRGQQVLKKLRVESYLHLCAFCYTDGWDEHAFHSCYFDVRD